MFTQTYKNTLRSGFNIGLKTTWLLSKIIFPITVALVILQHTPVLPWVVKVVAPLVGLLGLRGDAAIPLVLGNVLNLYAAIAGILSLELTVKEVFILAVMLSFAHNMFIETGVALKVGIKLWVVLLVRFGLALFWAVAINLVWIGGGEVAQYGLTPTIAEVPQGWVAIVLLGLQKAAFGVVQLAVIVIPLMMAIQLLKDYQYLQKFSVRVGPLTRLVGIQPNASLTLIAGLVTGLVYGAGIMVQAVKEDGVSKKDVTLALIFLMSCHAIIEDTLLFVPLGISIWPLLLIRLISAFALTGGVAFVWSWRQRHA